MNSIYLINSIAVAAFGMILSAAFCDILWTWRKRLTIAVSIAICLSIQGLIYFFISPDIVVYIYPLITHLPLIIVLYILSQKILWPTVSVLTAYLCCQTRRWLAMLIVTILSENFMTQDTAEIILTIPILLLLLRFIAPSVRSISHNTITAQWRFGLIPALYYCFDYLASIYTNLLLEGTLIVVEFMPFVCSVAYLIFIVYSSKEGWIRLQLEQTQDVMNLQISQAVREIEALRESQHKTRTYNHDLRHHLQYVSSCIENGRYEHAQEYIHEICSEIEANKVTSICENEAANLIFSTFVERAKASAISISTNATLSQNIPISENDLCVLLSNALENALHACQKLKEKGLSGTIDVSAYEKNGKFFLQIINSCDADIIFHDDIPVTSAQGHGIGVSSICAVVNKYDGIYSFSVKEGRFILRVSL